MVVCRGGGLNQYQGCAADCQKRALRSPFRQRLKPSVNNDCGELLARFLRPRNIFVPSDRPLQTTGETCIVLQLGPGSGKEPHI
jgi:hypothetical protein